MKVYYYSTRDAVYDTWSDSDLKKWLVDHGVVKSDARISREKMLKMIQLVANDRFRMIVLIFVNTSGVTTSLRTTRSGALGPIVRFAAGSLNMATCAPTLRSSETNL